MPNPVLIYTEKSSPRLKYILNIFFKDYLGLDYNITQNPVLFEQHEFVKINYSAQKFVKEGIKIKPFGLLTEFGIKDHLIEVHQDNNFDKVFFKTNGDLSFDLLSAAFWLLSRYEEYLPFKQDQFNRFDVKNSIAFQYDFIDVPLVNIWFQKLKQLILEKYPKLCVKQHNYTYVSTLDIDNAYKYKYKGIMRSTGGFLKSIFQLDINEIFERANVILNRKKDPFDSYQFILDTKKKFNLNLICFFLLGDYGNNDKNHPSNNRHFQYLIKHLADYCQIGIHPSFKSNGNLGQLKIEINRLANITHKDIKFSRQHFSILKFPDTYQALIQAGITQDFSMGYGNYNGFRASFCHPFYWYDIDAEQETPLLIHSFSLIETTLKFTNKANLNDALQKAVPIIEQVKKYDGELISIIHNDTMGNMNEWQGWQQVYEQIVEEAIRST